MARKSPLQAVRGPTLQGSRKDGHQTKGRVTLRLGVEVKNEKNIEMDFLLKLYIFLEPQ